MIKIVASVWLNQFNLISAGTFCGLFPKAEAAVADLVYYLLLIQFQIVSLRSYFG